MPDAQPIPGYKIKPAETPPQTGEVIIKYEVRKPETGCCKCQDMTQTGFILVIVLAILFWPAAFLVCLCDSNFEDYQVPVYGQSSDGAAVAPAEVAVPVAEVVKEESKKVDDE